MRKNNDGYVLPFVLVVMIVLCIMSASLMTAAFRNLQMQQKFTDQMVDKYIAQGKIEKIVAQLKQDRVVERDETEDLTPKELATIMGMPIDDVKQEGNPIGEDVAIVAGKPFDFIVSLETSPDDTTDTTIACELLISAEYTSTPVDEPSAYKHTIVVDSITYQSYEISTGGGT